LKGGVQSKFPKKEKKDGRGKDSGSECLIKLPSQFSALLPRIRKKGICNFEKKKE